MPDDQFDEAVRDWVATIASKSPVLLGLGKKALAATRDLPLDAALDYLQAQLAWPSPPRTSPGVRAPSRRSGLRSGATRDRPCHFWSDHNKVSTFSEE